MRSRAVSLPASCWRLRRSSPPPSSARRSRSVRASSLKLGSTLFTACDLLPVLQELLEADVGQRMVEQLIDHRRRAGAMSAPIRAASTTWIGLRQLATSTSVVNS